ncbi:MAG: DegT/DnrJ/EryC1/StrS family aminotransferase [Bacteroidales bacterium]|nr:DegT/DnrJ/EryC1/StrS family aminotransferase [Bacteroidales bacterium]
MFIPFVDLKAQYLSLKNDIDTAINNVINDTAFVGGKYLKEFEENFARAYGVKHCIGVANGTDAIYIVLKMLGIGQGDEVITVANSWISTSETISQTGAKPVFIDIEKDYFNINTDLIEDKITARTKAIIPVHLYGQPARIDIIKDLCQKHHLFLIEDCAQSHFAEYDGKFVGTFGHASTFSFYPGKNLGAYGDGGAIITNDDILDEKFRLYANHGALKKHHHLIEGINSRLDGLQAAILNAKLPHIHNWNSARLNNALLYNELLKDVKQLQVPKIRNNCKHIFHVYSLRAEHRNELMAYLNENDIQTAIHYPNALPFMPAYAYLGYNENDCPVAADYQHKILSLPMYPELSREQILFVADKIKSFYSN